MISIIDLTGSDKDLYKNINFKKIKTSKLPHGSHSLIYRQNTTERDITTILINNNAQSIHIFKNNDILKLNTNKINNFKDAENNIIVSNFKIKDENGNYTNKFKEYVLAYSMIIKEDKK